MHATAFLKAPQDKPTGAIVVLSGTERSLKLDALAALMPLVCGDGSDDSSATKFDGKDADLKSVRDELQTVSMFGDRRVVLVENADDFEFLVLNGDALANRFTTCKELDFDVVTDDGHVTAQIYICIRECTARRNCCSVHVKVQSVCTNKRYIRVCAFES